MPYRDSLRTPNQYPEPARIGGELPSVTRLAPGRPYIHIEAGRWGSKGGLLAPPRRRRHVFAGCFFCFLEPVSLMKLDFLFLVFSWITILSRDPNLLNFDLFKL